MQSFIHAAVIGLVTVVFVSLLKKRDAELAVVLSVAACAVIGVVIFELAQPLITFLERLRNLSGMDKELMAPMLKVLGIGLLTQVSASVCIDAGQSAIAKLIEVSGGLLSVYVALPLLEAVLELLEGMGGT